MLLYGIAEGKVRKAVYKTASRTPSSYIKGTALTNVKAVRMSATSNLMVTLDLPVVTVILMSNTR